MVIIPAWDSCFPVSTSGKKSHANFGQLFPTGLCPLVAFSWGTCWQPPAVTLSPQLLQFRLSGERECQQSSIQKGIQALLNIERRRALKGVHSFSYFVLCQENRGDGGRGERVGEQQKKCLGWALCAFYLMGSLPRQGLPLLSLLADQTEVEKSYSPPTDPSRKEVRKGEEERANSPMMPTVLSQPGELIPTLSELTGVPHRDPGEIWRCPHGGEQHCCMASNKRESPSISLGPAVPASPSCQTILSQLRANSIIKCLYSKDSLCVFVYLWISC